MKQFLRSVKVRKHAVQLRIVIQVNHAVLLHFPEDVNPPVQFHPQRRVLPAADAAILANQLN